MAQPRRARRGRATVREEERESAHYLTFALGEETFGVEITQVREILEYEPPTDLPMVPPYIRGVVNLRGMAVPVLDLARRMARGEGVISRRTCIVIMEVGGRAGEASSGVAVGVMVDGVHRVLEIAADDIEPPPALGGDIDARFIHGMARREGGFLVLLNIDHVFSGSEIALLGRLGDGDTEAAAMAEAEPEAIAATVVEEPPAAAPETLDEPAALEAEIQPDPTPTAEPAPVLEPTPAADEGSTTEPDIPIPVFGEATP